MSQFEQNNQPLDKVQQDKNGAASEKFDSKENYHAAKEIFKAIHEAGKNSKDVHHLEIHDDAKGGEHQPNSGKNQRDGGEVPNSATPAAGGDSNSKDSGAGSATTPQTDSNGASKSDGTTNGSGAKSEQFPTVTAKPEAGSVTLEPHQGGSALVMHIDTLPAPPPLPNNMVIVK